LRRILNLLGWAGVALVVAALALMYFRPDQTALAAGPGDRRPRVRAALHVQRTGGDRRRVLAAGRRGTACCRSRACSSCSACSWHQLRAGRQNKRWDLTANKQFSLSGPDAQGAAGPEAARAAHRVRRDTAFSRFRDRLTDTSTRRPTCKVEYVDIVRQRHSRPGPRAAGPAVREHSS